VKITIVNNEKLPYRDAFARPLGVELVSRLLAGLEVARGDVDPGPVLHEAVGHHLADAAAAARDNDDFVLHVEEVAEVEGAHAAAWCRVLIWSELFVILLRIQVLNYFLPARPASSASSLVWSTLVSGAADSFLPNGCGPCKSERDSFLPNGCSRHKRRVGHTQRPVKYIFYLCVIHQIADQSERDLEIYQYIIVASHRLCEIPRRNTHVHVL